MFHLDMMKHWSKPGLPGLSVEEVQQAAKRINKLSGLVALVSMIVAQLISEHDFTLIQTIDKLEDDLQKIMDTKVGSQDDQTPQAP
jgi:uncharacterized protein YoaH (UPF0181 family)